MTELCNMTAVWGPPYSGKTATALNMALCAASSGKQVILLLCDNLTPALPVLFPDYRREEMNSVGRALSSVDIGESEILRAAVTLNEAPGILFLGYLSGENRASFPSCSDARAEALLSVISQTADTVICDCMSDYDTDVMTRAAIRRAGHILRIYTPELRSISFYDSQLPLLECREKEDTHIKVINSPFYDDSPAVDDIRRAAGGCSAVIPYSGKLRRKLSEGCIDGNPGRKYRREIKAVTHLCCDK